MLGKQSFFIFSFEFLKETMNFSCRLSCKMKEGVKTRHTCLSGLADPIKIRGFSAFFWLAIDFAGGKEYHKRMTTAGYLFAFYR